MKYQKVKIITNEKITVENCLEISENQFAICQEQSSKAWLTVFDYLKQNGFKANKNTGIESVIYFLENNLKKNGN